MSDEARIFAAIAIGSLVALGLPKELRVKFGVPIAALTVAIGVLPVMTGWKQWVAVGFVISAAFAASKIEDDTERDDDPTTRLGRLELIYLSFAIAAILVAALLVGYDEVWDRVRETWNDNDVVGAFLIGLGVVFVGGAIVKIILTPFARVLADSNEITTTESSGLAYAGLVIGWLERGLIFAFVLAGQPEAAGLAIAAKSLARIPEIQKAGERFAEYFLVGTLSSVAIAVGAGELARVVLGL